MSLSDVLGSTQMTSLLSQFLMRMSYLYRFYEDSF